MYRNKLKKHGFTVIELVVIMAVMAILVFLGSMGYQGYTKQAQLTRLQFDTRLLSDACQRFYVDNGDYPRLADTPYTADQVTAFSSKVYDQKGVVISIDNSGNYYDLDFSKLKKYVTINEDYKNFLLQNPVGDIYFLEPSRNIRLPENVALIPGAPMIDVEVINNPPSYNITYPNNITPEKTEYQIDGGSITTSIPSDVLREGSHTINVRYKFNGYYSNWTTKDFTVQTTIPGPTVLTVGDSSAGFYGKVNNLITGDDLRSLTGVNYGAHLVTGNINWLKFSYNGNIEFVADRCISNYISWDQLNSNNCVTGKVITINGHQYKVRLIKGTPVSYSEWDQLICSNLAPGSFNNYSSTTHNICQETIDGYCIVRGGPGNAAIYGNTSIAMKTSDIGWRPVLELVN